MGFVEDVGRLPRELRVAAVAALALGATMVLPWYQKSFFTRGIVVKDSVSAFGAFSFVEAAVLLVALAVLFLVWARSQRRGFHLPGGDGTAVTLAGGWAALLLVWRLFDTPSVAGPGATIGIQWGIFCALLAAGALTVSGLRTRAARAPEPPNPAAEGDDEWVAPRPRSDRAGERRPVDPSAVTEVLGERPGWEGDVPDPPRRGD